MRFYQAIDLPKGTVPGVWDHRGTTNVYLAHTDFTRLTALDVGPANGFWSFEMEKRGADVTAIELGPNDKWDTVPHGAVPTNGPDVEAVHKDFWTCHQARASSVKVVRGSAYDAPSLVSPVDVALMGNILQHLRDPFLAIERIGQVVRKRIIISESIWTGDEAFLSQAQLQLIPRSHTPSVNHSWYQTSPVFVMEVLKILGFGNLKNEYHMQRFNGTPGVDDVPRMIRHFTVSADRLSSLQAP